MRGLGNDIIEIKRVADNVLRHGDRFLDKLFTKAEQEYCLNFKDPAPRLAGRFAAKEAVVKALGTGFGTDVSFKDIEIINDSQGKPVVYLSDALKDKFGDPQILLTISHCKEYATAVAIYL